MASLSQAHSFLSKQYLLPQKEGQRMGLGGAFKKFSVKGCSSPKLVCRNASLLGVMGWKGLENFNRSFGNFEQ